MHEVCELELPAKSSERVKTRVTEARQRLNSRIYERSDGRTRLGRPYLVRDPYFEFFVRARASADMVVQWQDDLGVTGEWRQRMDVAMRKTPGP
jgi:hypothetical protein